MSMYLYTALNKFAQGVDISETSLKIPKQSLTENAFTNGLQLFFGVAAAVAVLIIAISALRLTTSQGDPQAIARARSTVIYASIGLAITLTAFAIVTFVIERVSS